MEIAAKLDIKWFTHDKNLSEGVKLDVSPKKKRISEALATIFVACSD